MGYFLYICENKIYQGKNLIIATGGLGYPTLGATGDGYVLMQRFWT